MFKLMDKKIFAILRKSFFLNWPNVITYTSCEGLTNAQSCLSLFCLHTQSMDVDEDSDQILTSICADWSKAPLLDNVIKTNTGITSLVFCCREIIHNLGPTLKNVGLL